MADRQTARCVRERHRDRSDNFRIVDFSRLARVVLTRAGDLVVGARRFSRRVSGTDNEILFELVVAAVT